jgi:hypothetical protein
MKPGPVETQLKALREARWRELNPEPGPKSVDMSNVGQVSNVQVSNVQSSVQLDIPLDKSLDTPKVGSAAYWRERKRAQRAAKAALTSHSSAAA